MLFTINRTITGRWKVHLLEVSTGKLTWMATFRHKEHAEDYIYPEREIKKEIQKT